MAADDLGSKPMINASIGRKTPPPPTPPTLPNAAPKNPISDPSTIRHPNSIGCFKTKELNIHKMHHIVSEIVPENIALADTFQ
jgi:hypothetical protein